MGKNQTYKAQQRAKSSSHSSSSAPGEEGQSSDGMVDGTFHSPEWHAARLASLQTSHTVTWEEWKAQRKEEARIAEEADGFEEKRMKEYREQLDKERANKLARGRNHADKKEKKKDKDGKKDKDKDKSRKSRKSKKRRSDSDSDSESEDSGSDRKRKKSKKSKRSSDSDDSDSDRKKKKKKSKKSKKKRKDDSSSSSEEEDKGPVRLSSFFTSKDGDLSPISDGDEDKDRSDLKKRTRWDKA